MTNYYEYIPIIEFAKRMGIEANTARQWAHSKDLKAYVRRRNSSAKSTIFINWTLWQRDFERGIV